MNIYAYVKNDPVNFTDPLGLGGCSIEANVCGSPSPYDLSPNAGALGSATYEGAFHADSEGRDRPCQLTDVSENCAIYVIGRKPPKPPKISAPPISVGPVSIVSAQPGLLHNAAERTGGGNDQCSSEGSESLPDGNWAEACAAHDVCYGTPGAIKELCDSKLILDITAACSGKIFVPAICLVRGVIYGGALIFFGVTPFYHPSRDAFNRAQTQGRGH